MSVVHELKTGESDSTDQKSLRLFVLADDERICTQLGENLLLNEQLLADVRVVVGWKAADWGVENRCKDYIILMSLSDRYPILTAFDSLKPTAVILYNVDAWIVRQLEVFEASRVATDDDQESASPLKVYMLVRRLFFNDW